MTLTEGARRVAAGFAATGGVARGADLIEQRVLGDGDQFWDVAGSATEAVGIAKRGEHLSS